MVKVAVVELSFPQPAVAVNITVAEPVSPQPSERPVKSVDQAIAEQSSVAVVPPLFANQAFNAATFPLLSHSSISLAAGFVMDCDTDSKTDKEEAVEVALPHASETVEVTSTASAQPEAAPQKLFVQERVPQSSKAKAPP